MNANVTTSATDLHTVPGATLIRRSDNSAATMARLHFERTGERTSPYRSHPERESYTETEAWLVNGQEVERSRAVHVWAGQCSFGRWA